jgi:hypothetical protein
MGKLNAAKARWPVAGHWLRAPNEPLNFAEPAKIRAATAAQPAQSIKENS